MSFLPSSLAPTGTVLPYAGSAAPAGWVLCDGSAISRTTYSALFTVLSTTYGVGDGSTTFNIPNAQGVFLRGAGSQTISAVSYTGTRGTTQGDQIQGHYHSSLNTLLATDGIVSGGAGSNFRRAELTGAIGNPSSDGTNGTPRTGSQTHPANISVNYIIKI